MEREEYLEQETYRLSRIITAQGWAIGQLKILIYASNREYAEKKMLEVTEKLNIVLEDERVKGDELRQKLFEGE